MLDDRNKTLQTFSNAAITKGERQTLKPATKNFLEFLKSE